MKYPRRNTTESRSRVLGPLWRKLSAKAGVVGILLRQESLDLVGVRVVIGERRIDLRSVEMPDFSRNFLGVESLLVPSDDTLNCDTGSRNARIPPLISVERVIGVPISIGAAVVLIDC